MSTLPTFTGTQVNYLVVCHRKLWLFSHGVEMERENDNVLLGKLIGGQSYSRAQKEVAIDDRIVIDWVESQVGADGVLTLHEVKKSRSFDKAHRLQVLYYLYYLKQKGIAARGEINYPLLRKRETVELTEEDETYIEKVLLEIENITSNLQAPPRLEKKQICRKCAYFELCYS